MQSSREGETTWQAARRMPGWAVARHDRSATGYCVPRTAIGMVTNATSLEVAGFLHSTIRDQ
eukprot:6175149-Pleurochrysis_carterae.AAC.2